MNFIMSKKRLKEKKNKKGLRVRNDPLLFVFAKITALIMEKLRRLTNMGIFRLSTGTIRIAVNVLGTVALLTSEVILPCIKKRASKEKTNSKSDVSYDDVIGIVMNSNMLSDNKVKVTAIIPRNGDVELFKAIIQIVNSDMNSANIIEAIKCICAK